MKLSNLLQATQPGVVALELEPEPTDSETHGLNHCATLAPPQKEELFVFLGKRGAAAFVWRLGLQTRNAAALRRRHWGWKGGMNPVDCTREVLARFGTDTPKPGET